MRRLPDDLAAFLQDHRRLGQLTSGADGRRA
jgi:hypothetical protein